MERQTVSSYIGREPFHPEIPKESRRYIRELVDQTFILYDATVIPDYQSEFGVSPMALLLLEDGNGQRFTTGSFNQVVINQVSKMLGKEDFPPEEGIEVTVRKTDRYYHLA